MLSTFKQANYKGGVVLPPWFNFPVEEFSPDAREFLAPPLIPFLIMIFFLYYY